MLTPSPSNFIHCDLRRRSNRRAYRSAISFAIMAAAVILSAAPFFASASTEPRPPLGLWITDNGNLEIEIATCGEAICGTVVKVLANRSMSGSGEMAAADNRNPLGMIILKDFKPSSDGEWHGEIYNRENAKTYSCTLSLENPDQLIVHPYVGLPLFGKNLIWRRAAAASRNN